MQPERRDRRATLIACSHGTDSPDGQAAVQGLADAVRDDMRGGVVQAFVDVQWPSLPQMLARLHEPCVPNRPGTVTMPDAGHHTPRTVVVPLLLSAGYHVRVDMADAIAERPGARLASALGPDERLIDILVARLAASGLPRHASVVLGAAGSSDARAATDCRRAAEMLARRLGRPVRCGFLSAAGPSVKSAIAAARAARPGAPVFVASYLLAPGYFSALLDGCGADAVTSPLLVPGEPPAASLVSLVIDRYLAARDARTAHTVTATETMSA